MIKIRDMFPTVAIVIFLTVAACGSVEAVESDPTPETFFEEELAAQDIATARAEKTQIASRILPYAEISDGEQTFLAFWFTWNDETVFLPIAESTMADSGLLSCRLDPEREIAIGTLFSGWEFLQDECVVDEDALENALPIIKIAGHFEDGIETEGWNVIDLHGEHAENFADVVTFIIENDLLGSGDLFISLYRTDGPNGDSYSAVDTVPTYTLPAEALEISFSSDQLGNFEYVDDVVYALEREFTWKIPAGFRELNLSPGDENWFVLRIDESGLPLSAATIQIKGVGASATPDN